MTANNQTPNLGLVTQVVHSFQLVWRLSLDSRVPLLPKLIVPLVVLYVLSPIDLIPDMIPIAGQLDDIGVLFLGMRFFIELCPPDVVMEHRRALGEDVSVKSEEVVDATYRIVDDDQR